MRYTLLTGATGLLGNYLLRDLLLAGLPVVVVVRNSRRLTARQRIDGLLAQWDEELGTPLPRPVVLEGDITEDDLGLDANHVRWLAEYCGRVIHNAASLTFHATSEEGEPYRSNINGTRNVLELCRSLGIREFHHVSTAYVAGLRSGHVLESDVDVGQEFGNDYERSKLAAEQLVRSSDFIDPPTIYRPSIIIGDSRTGFTTTYHGFYAALQLTHTIVKTLPTNETGRVGGFPIKLSLDGNETKHLVPVDWVSAAMTHIITHPELHGETYHLTPRHPVNTRLLRDVLEETVRFYGAKLAGSDYEPDPANEHEGIFVEHIRVYDSYWRMDPAFDRTNIERAVPHLPCPAVDRDLLVRLSNVAIESNFPTPSKKPVEVEFDAQSLLQQWLDLGTKLTARQPQDRLLGLDIVGTGGGQWQLVVHGDQVVGAETGIHEDRLAVCRVDIGTFAGLARGEQSWTRAFDIGSAKLVGNGLSPAEYASLLDQVVGVEVS